MFSHLWLAAALAASSSAKECQVDVSRRAAQLVAQLGNSSYRARERATQELVRFGSIALEPLRSGLNDPDPEIADRCRKLVPLAYDRRISEQINIFLTGPDGPVPPELPFVERWIAISGSGNDSRQLYARLINDHRRLLLEMNEHPENAADLYVNHCTEAYLRSRNAAIDGRAEEATLSDLVLFLFFGADPKVCQKRGPGRAASAYANFFLSPASLGPLLSGPTASQPIKAVFLTWMEQQRSTFMLRRAMNLAVSSDLKEAGRIALNLAADKTNLPTTRSSVLAGAAKLIGPEHLKKLNELIFDDLTVVGRTTVNGEVVTLELRDIALGVAVQATGQNLADYGFTRFRDNSPVANPSSLYGLTDKSRDESLAKWKLWCDNQPN